jgi:hypothetical protein
MQKRKPKRFLVTMTFEIEVEAPNAAFALWSAKYRIRCRGGGTVVGAEAIQGT